MRKVLFVHNGPLYRADDGRVFGTHYSDAIKQRYLRLGDHVTFLMREAQLSGDPSRYSHITEDRFSFVPVPDLMSPSKRILNHREAMRIIEQEVRAADILVARIPSLTARLAVARAKALGKPYIIECVACNWDALWNHNWKAKISAPWYFLMQRSVVAQSPYVIYVTSDFLQRRYPSRGQKAAISNVELTPTASSVIDQRIQRIRSKGNPGIPLKLITVADVAVPYKGQGDVIKILPRILAVGVNVEYHLIGGGDPARLQALAKRLGVDRHVIFHGAHPHADVVSMLDDMDIYIQPSRQEGLPRALIEAMSRGLPALGAQTGGIPELLSPDRIFQPGNKREIFVGLKELATDIDEQERDAKRNHSVSLNYSETVLTIKRKEFFDAFLNGQTLGNSDV